MSKEDQVLELIKGYANGLITDTECNYHCDLALNELSIIDGMCYDHSTGDLVPKEEYLKNN
tara:strand:+ start:248 stop:430 length:183 start_codon:yes stop_codon:yes gene_type:complete